MGLRRHHFATCAHPAGASRTSVQEGRTGILSRVVRARHLEMLCAGVALKAVRERRWGAAILGRSRADTQRASGREAVGGRDDDALHLDEGAVAVGLEGKADESVALGDAGDGVGHDLCGFGRVEGSGTDVCTGLVDALRLLRVDERGCERMGRRPGGRLEELRHQVVFTQIGAEVTHKDAVLGILVDGADGALSGAWTHASCGGLLETRGALGHGGVRAVEGVEWRSSCCLHGGRIVEWTRHAATGLLPGGLWLAVQMRQVRCGILIWAVGSLLVRLLRMKMLVLWLLRMRERVGGMRDVLSMVGVVMRVGSAVAGIVEVAWRGDVAPRRR